MITFALTGGIGMGKSTAAGILRHRGLPVVDSDELAHQLVEPGQPALDEIWEVFGDAILDADGRLRRSELARIVFSDSARRRTLEGILHPRIRDAWRTRLESWRLEGCPCAIAVIPLLFETDAAGSFDRTICVACSETTQRQRLRDRGWSDVEIDHRIAAQMPVGKKMDLADHVAWTEGDPGVLRSQLERIVK